MYKPHLSWEPALNEKSYNDIYPEAYINLYKCPLVLLSSISYPETLVKPANQLLLSSHKLATNPRRLRLPQGCTIYS